MPKLRTLLAVVILVAFVVFVEAWFGWRALLSPWREVTPSAILAAALLTLFTYWLRAVRVYDYYRDAMRGRFLVCLRLTLVHNLLNNLLPMRTGELSFPLLMARHFQVPATHSVPVLLWFRLMDLHTLGLFAWLAVGGFVLGWWVALPVAAAWLALLPVARRLAPWLRDALGDPQGGRLRAFAWRAFDALPDSPRAFWRAWGWTFANWLVKLAVFVWVLGLFLEVPSAAAWLAVIAGDLTSVLPVHGVAGAGTYEAGVVAALLPFGVAADAALVAAVNLHLFLLGSAVFGGLLAFALPGGRHGPKED
ncbi:hypothetical protein B1C78_15935 [Thioalkalivibrio denitrificans]|uniref:Lysylphosphatidylglycerol synthetase n=1 Tax=Thioalkalivibrio denitrificans TaxID=108003 RepID=A0A1V3NAF4_9GAMM|nr:lysylphosphatidylglycerol synthase domain-containing protein [Thioalkalivibrio denitrificans]OOG21802.1 hypothetical protein B1C78_15935 [Thioalkalivibrio denitrificans]